MSIYIIYSKQIQMNSTIAKASQLVQKMITSNGYVHLSMN